MLRFELKFVGHGKRIEGCVLNSRPITAVDENWGDCDSTTIIENLRRVNKFIVVCYNSSSSSDSSPDSQVFVVVDTNVFIVGLDHLKSLLTDGNGLGHGLIFYLPWAVVRELDNLKGRGNRSEGQQGGSNRNIEASARRAISFLLSELQRGNDKVRIECFIQPTILLYI